MIGKRISHFRIVSELGRGGMGVVYLAEDEKLRRRVALKLLPHDTLSDVDLRRRFLHEARAAAAVTHSRIAVVHEVGEAEDQIFIAMEHVPGVTLRSVLGDGPLQLEEALRLGIEIAEALAKAHEAGVVHRDLKPENIMVDSDGHAKVLDFGLAKHRHLPPKDPLDQLETATADLTVPGQKLGTPAYMSPEQVKFQDVDVDSDLFAFGIVFYEMLAGKNPFRKPTYEETLAAILHETPEPVHHVRKGVPRRLDRIIQRCLHKESGQRYASAAELLRELRSFETEIQRPVWLRPRALGWAASVALVALAAIAIKTLWDPFGPRPGSETVANNVIAVLPFSYRGQPEYEYLGTGMMDLVSAAIHGAGDFRTVDGMALTLFVRQEALDVEDPSAGRAACRRFDAGCFVQGSVIESGGHIRVHSSVYGPDGDRLLTVATEGDESRAFAIADDLARQIVADRLGSSGERLAGTASLSTESIVALKAYLDGEQLNRAGNFLAAREAFGRAVAADTAFALAHFRLALVGGEGGDMYRSLERALRHGDRLSVTDRALVEAYSHFWHAEASQAIERLRFVLERRPDDPEAWFILGETLYYNAPRLGMPPAETRHAYEMALSYDPNNANAVRMLMRVEAREENYARVDSLLDSLLRLETAPQDNALNHAQRAFARDDPAAQDAILEEIRQLSSQYVYWASQIVAIYSGNLDGAIRIADVLTDPSREPEWQARGQLWAGMIELARGRWAAARARFDAAVTLRQEVWMYRAILTLHPQIRSTEPELVEIRDAIANLDPKRWRSKLLRPYLCGLLALQLHDPASFDGSVSALDSLVDPSKPATGAMARDLTLALQAHRAWSEGKPQEALDLLDRMDPEVWWIPGESTTLLASLPAERYLRGQILERLGREEEALDWYGGLVFDGQEIVYRAPAHFRRAEIFEKLGRLEEARDHYGRCIEWWRDCDADLRPLVDAAKRRLAALEPTARATVFQTQQDVAEALRPGRP